MKEKGTSQAMHKQEHVKKGFCKGSSSSHGVDETKDSYVITLEGDEQDDISDGGNVSGHVESNLSECADNENNATQGVASEKDVENNVVQDVTPEYNTVLKPKRNSFVKFQSVEGSEWQHAKILSVQPKQTGKYGKWVNVHVMGEEEPRSIDWSQVHNWRNVLYPENVVMMTQDEELAQVVVDAKEKEIKNLIENDVFESVQNENQPTISSRWIITEKFKDGKKIVKACLVARGFEEDLSNFTKDSPTCSRECLRLLFLYSRNSFVPLFFFTEPNQGRTLCLLFCYHVSS